MKAIELKDKDTEKMCELNAANKWGLTADQLRELAKEHQTARAKNNAYKMALIEYRLTDINYHGECAMLERGQYDELMKIDF